MATAKKITIHDVALAAGVSVSTVSLVLSGKGRISTATGERVNAAIEELGFVRNRQASALRGGQSGVIGLIVRDLSAPFYADAWRLRTNPSSSMAALTRSPVAVEIRPLPLSTSETVLTDTPAASATS